MRKDYRDKIVAAIEDPRVRSFFEDEFGAWNERQRAEYLGSVQNKIGQFLSNPFIRNILGAWRPSVDFSNVVEDRKVLVVRLSKGTLGEEPANLLGSLVATGIHQAAMRRAGLPEGERQDFFLFIDEFQNFTTDAFSSVLSEARKYGLSLTVAHQYLDQLSNDVRAAVFGNVGSIVSFRVSGGDADLLAREIGDYSPDTLRGLGRGGVCARLTNEGEAMVAFLGRTDPATSTAYGRSKLMINRSRRHFSERRKVVEERIMRWLQ